MAFAPLGRCFSLATCLLVLTPLAFAEERKPWQYVTIGAAFGQDILGSEDARRGTFYSFGWAKAEPQFKFRGMQPQLHQELFYLFTRGGGFDGIPVNNLNTFGYSFFARIPVPWFGKHSGGFIDAGWGFSLSNNTTRDLDSQLNSCPLFGFGVNLGRDSEVGFLVVRWFHMSNAGLKGNNQGMNQIQLLLGYRL